MLNSWKNIQGVFLFLALALLLIGCSMGMMGYSSLSVPAEYSRLSNPISSNNGSLDRGAVTFQTYCTSCHGDSGRGDGQAAQALDPQPANLASKVHMLSDAYIYYRISEGGNFDPYNSAMISFKDILSENERWDLVNFIRSLGGGMMGGGMMGR